MPNDIVTNIEYNTTNDPVLQITKNGDTEVVQTPDTTPRSGSKNLITSGGVSGVTGDINNALITLLGSKPYKFPFNSTKTVSSDKVWSAKTWSGLSSFNGNKVWTDGTNIYYSSGTTHYVLDKSTSTWSSKSWNGLNSFAGDYIWTDGDNIYYSGGTSSDQYVLDKSTSTWSKKTWSGLTSFDGIYIWTDGTNIYYSNSSNQYVLTSNPNALSTSCKPKF